MWALPDYPAPFWAAAIAAVLTIGISKAGFGAGIAMISTPVLALTIPVTDAVALLLPLLIVSDFMALYQYRASYDKPSLAVLIPGSILGISVGWLFFGYFSDNEQLLKVGVGILALAFVAFQLGRKTLFGWMGARSASPAEGVFWGALSGFVSTLAHVGSPPMLIYLLPKKLPRDLFVGTSIIFFMVTNLVKLVPYGQLGLIRVGNLFTILLLFPVAYIGVKLGVILNNRFNDLWFNRAIYSILVMTGIQLILS